MILAGAAAAVDYAVANGARIISAASWAGGGNSQILLNAIQNAQNSGVLFVAAAGNESENNDAVPSYPASYALPNILAVAATSKDDALADFSNFGERSVQIASPGVDIYSTIPKRIGNASTPSSGYASLMGTSMATPIVSAASALAMTRFPSLSHLDIRKLLISTVDPVDSLNKKVAANGRLNIAKLLSPPLPAHLAGTAGVAASVHATLSESMRAMIRVMPRSLFPEQESFTLK